MSPPPTSSVFQNFRKPKASAKIRLINPTTGHEVELPPARDGNPKGVPSAPLRNADAGGKPAKRIPKQPKDADKKSMRPLEIDVELATRSGSVKSTETTSEMASKATPPASSKESHDSKGREPRWKPDVYAHAYVPEAFLAVNASAAILLSSTPARAIDFFAYTSVFASPLFLPPLPPLSAPTLDGRLSVESTDTLTAETYGLHLSDCLVLDLEAQVPEIRTYDMFGVGLDVVDRVQEVYSLRIPGLRENTPRVAYGDNILVRQLIMDPATQLPLAAPASGSTGFQISAVVDAVDRPNETVSLRINGFTPHLLMCNIMFIVQTRWVKSLQRAVGNVASALIESQKYENARVSENGTPEYAAPAPEHDFGPIGTPVRSSVSKAKQDYFGIVKTTGPLTNVSTEAEQDRSRINGSNVRSPGPKRQDAFRTIGSPTRGGNHSSWLIDNGEAKPRSRSASYEMSIDPPAKYTSQGWLRRMLFPSDSDGVMQTSLPQGVFKRSWFDRHLNHEQKKAVDAILSSNYGNIPFLVHGPPGTGKTKTVVETVTQLAFDAESEGTILVCAPSDSAADTLALRLRNHFEPKVLFRMNDFSRTFAEVPQEILPYCYVQDDIFNLPPLPELMACKIVIATCRATDILIQARVTNRDLVTLESNTSDLLNPQRAAKRRVAKVCQLHWTALLIDEAAQATEPEMLMPLSVVAPPTSYTCKPNPSLVMAGDQYQLGPRIYDGTTTLRISLFERLSNRVMYADHPLARQSHRRLGPPMQMPRPAFVNLTRNYRSHPAILAIPSALFYADTLIPEAADTDQLESWPGWQGRKWPVLFACNGGIDDCENIKVVGGGWFNVREAKKAISYAASLLDEGHIKEQKEICIMSPFRSQVTVLRNVARKAGLWGLNIGPMDAFQGLENRFVIICTTRTRTRFLEEDSMKGAGIVHEAKKFNVAITRAKQGLIVLGNPWVLEHDPHWRVFLRFCWRNGLWQKDTDEQDKRMAELQEKNTNEWEPGTQSEMGMGGLEKALLYKEREPVEGGSRAVRRFMSERGEDEIWTLGRLAEATLEDEDG
ncbi:MAG: hypothetical protein LQ352_002556 [Teloschistes flavicans]|nr:MAG: hypothetical protein LQ352_002556 [Teloschistes flavicans]